MQPGSDTIYVQWALPSIYDKCEVGLVNMDVDPNTEIASEDIIKGAETSVDRVYASPSLAPGVKVKVTVKGVNTADSSETAAVAELFTQTTGNAPTITVTYPTSSTVRVQWSNIGKSEKVWVALWSIGDPGYRTSASAEALADSYADISPKFGVAYTVAVFTEREGFLSFVADSFFILGPAPHDLTCFLGGTVKAFVGETVNNFGYVIGNTANVRAFTCLHDTSKNCYTFN